MDRLRLQTADQADENFKKLAALFPNAVTETIDANGEVVRAIDKDVLMQEISRTVVEGREERYQFTWPDKRKAIIAANAPTSNTLRPYPKESENFDTTENLYIEGDNLEVLKLLQENYLGQIKMIYIDPPYNTGNDFVYEDDFAESTSEYLANSGQYDEEGNRLTANTESNGRFHTDWLNMIFPRLKVSRNLLSEDGLIFISIDDKEVENLIKVCNEIFGEKNFVGNIIWQSRTSISNDDNISTNHNHTLIYARDIAKIKFGGDDIDPTDYINPDNDPRGPWKLVPIDANHVGGDTRYPIRNPKTGVDYYPPTGRIWCYSKKNMQELMDDGRIKFGISDDSSPKRKLFYNERMAKGDLKTPSSILLDAGTTKSGTSEIMGLFEGEKIFDYPKPTTLITRLMQYALIKDNDIVLDFFSGSGTTAHACFSYTAEKKHAPKFILVQLPENLDQTLLTANNDAKKTIKVAITYLDKLTPTRAHNICEIAKEHIRRAAKKIKAEHPDAKFDGGFRVLKLDSNNMEDVSHTPEDTVTQGLWDYVSNIKEGRTPLDLLFQAMLELNVPLSAHIEEETIDGKKVYNVNDGYILASFDDNLTDEIITEIAKRKPYYFVMRDSSMADDSVAVNFEQLFKSYSPDTVLKVF